jgi:hypothetical protein
MSRFAQPQASVKVQFAAARCAEIPLIVDVLTALDDAYRGLFRWARLIDNAQIENATAGSSGQDRAREQSLCLVEIETVAPAQVEVIGLEEPISRLRSYLAERDRRAGNDAYRDERSDWLRGDCEILSAAGYSNNRIDRAVSDLFALFTRLNSHAEVRLIDY